MAAKNKTRLSYFFLSSLLALLLCQCAFESAPEKRSLYRPAQDLGGLFEAVQMAGVFPDSKTLVDSRPLHPPQTLRQAYQKLHGQDAFSLQAFVAQNFELPSVNTEAFSTNKTRSMESHLQTHWHYLTRPADKQETFSSLLPLPHSYVVPGGRFREIYYWDSYFTMLGLAASDRWDLVQSMLDNFAYLLATQGRIPNGNRSYYLSRSQPPFFSSMVSLWRKHQGDRAALNYLVSLQQEYRFWMDGAAEIANGEAKNRVVRLPDGHLLNRYYDDLAQPRPESYREDRETAAHTSRAASVVYRDLRAAAESGWDFSSRWFADGLSLTTIETTAIIPVDLNCLLHHLETQISELLAEDGQHEASKRFKRKAEKRKQAIQAWLWHDELGVYLDYQFKRRQATSVLSLATVYPLYFAIASPRQAKSVAANIRGQFLYPGGLVTSLRKTGEQWDFPNGWAPLQWLAVAGLDRYQEHALASDIAQRWIDLNRKVFNDTGRMMEKYNVVDIALTAGGGEYPLQDGFGWTNGVALALLQAEYAE